MDAAMVCYVVKCRQGGDDSMIRRASAVEALQVLERAMTQGWSLAEITRGRLVIDETALRQDAELEMAAA